MEMVIEKWEGDRLYRVFNSDGTLAFLVASGNQCRMSSIEASEPAAKEYVVWVKDTASSGRVDIGEIYRRFVANMCAPSVTLKRRHDVFMLMVTTYHNCKRNIQAEEEFLLFLDDEYIKLLVSTYNAAQKDSGAPIFCDLDPVGSLLSTFKNSITEFGLSFKRQHILVASYKPAGVHRILVPFVGRLGAKKRIENVSRDFSPIFPGSRSTLHAAMFISSLEHHGEILLTQEAADYVHTLADIGEEI